MKNFLIILNSTIFMVLFCFSDTYSLPLTRSCYTPPEDKIDMAVKEEFIYIEKMSRRDSFSFNLGIPGDTSLGLDFSLVHSNFVKSGEDRPGDIIFNIWHFTGDYFDGFVNSGISMFIRIPTGPDAYTDETFRNLSFGNNELKIAPALSFNISDKDVLVLNLSYTFREGRGEDLYDGFKINPLNGDTYRSCLGLNPFFEDSFFNGGNLKNDYASIAVGLITSRMYPWIFFSEIYYSSGVYKRKQTINAVNIEGNGVNPLLLSAGIKYFFLDSFFVQVSEVLSLLQYDGYTKNTIEFSMNIFF